LTTKNAEEREKREKFRSPREIDDLEHPCSIAIISRGDFRVTFVAFFFVTFVMDFRVFRGQIPHSQFRRGNFLITLHDYNYLF
jgi:hypothetical protein